MKLKIAVITLFLILTTLTTTATALDNDGGGSWQEYMSFPITTSPSEYAQYRIEISGTTWEIYNVEGNLEVSGTNNNFWSIVQDDGEDIRVFDESGNQMYFWIEEWDYSNQKAVIWVNLTAGSTELNIAYGNPSATKSAYENGEQVFEFFDDFEDKDISDWETYNGVWTAENGYLEQTSTAENGYRAKHSTFSTGRDVIITADVYIDASNYRGIAFADVFGTARNAVNGYLFDAVANAIRLVGTSGSSWGNLFKISKTLATTLSAGWYKLMLIVASDGTIIGRLYDLNGNLIDELNTTDTYYSTAGVGVNVFDASGKWDNIIVLKLADPADFGTPTVKTFEDPPEGERPTRGGDAPLLGDKSSDPKYYAYRLERVTEFDYVTGQDYSIVSVYLNDIGFNSTQTVLLDAYGEIYTLTITATAEEFIGAWKNFTVTLTYPNGSVKTWNDKRINLAAQDYDVKIQYYFSEMDTVLDIDIYIGGLLEFPVSLNSPGQLYNLSTFVLFNRVQGTSTKEMDVEIYYAYKDWWKEVQQNQDWLPSLPNIGKTLWDKFLEAVSQIPVAGDYLADGLNFMAVMVGESFFYIKLFFVENWEITVLTFEAFAMMYAMQSRSIFTMFRRYYHFHEAALLLMFNIIKETLNLIWRLIQAVGSLIPFT